MNSTQDTPDIALAKKAIAGEVVRTLQEKLERLRKEYPKLSFSALWDRLKEQEPDLFAQAKRIEDNDWGTEVLSKVVYEKQAHPRLNWASLTCKLMVRWGQNAPLGSRSNPP